MTNVKQDFIKVHCPKCSNRRLFDLAGYSNGVVRIKCPQCRNEVELQLDKCNEDRNKRLIAFYRNHK